MKLHDLDAGLCPHTACPAHMPSKQLRHETGCIYALYGNRTELTLGEIAFALGARTVDVKHQLNDELEKIKDLSWLVELMEAAENTAAPPLNAAMAQRVLSQYPFGQIVATPERLASLIEYLHGRRRRRKLRRFYRAYPFTQNLRDLSNG